MVGVFRLPLRLGGFDPVEQLCFLMRRLSEAREDGDVSPRECWTHELFRTSPNFPHGPDGLFFLFWISLHLAAGEDPLGLKPNVNTGSHTRVTRLTYSALFISIPVTYRT